MIEVVIKFERGRDGGNVPMIILWKGSNIIEHWHGWYELSACR